ncbi:hypothetical protein [Desulfosarcina widdelii]|uniref:hypothetical protein n=1 Tax=Desulfosarcina widdelii TaxID=947919 RepID=UPI0012D2BEA8|nr:hypothetical protein [Desulfosarcina widdelii]
MAVEKFRVTPIDWRPGVNGLKFTASLFLFIQQTPVENRIKVHPLIGGPDLVRQLFGLVFNCGRQIFLSDVQGEIDDIRSQIAHCDPFVFYWIQYKFGLLFNAAAPIFRIPAFGSKLSPQTKNKIFRLILLQTKIFTIENFLI